MKRFGIDFYGNHAIIKLTAKLDSENKELIKLQYGNDLHIFSTVDKKGIERVRFEGCIEQSRFAEFLKDFKLAHKRTKLNAMAQEIEELENPFPQFCGSIHIDDDDLPF